MVTLLFTIGTNGLTTKGKWNHRDAEAQRMRKTQLELGKITNRDK